MQIGRVPGVCGKALHKGYQVWVTPDMSTEKANTIQRVETGEMTKASSGWLFV